MSAGSSLPVASPVASPNPGHPHWSDGRSGQLRDRTVEDFLGCSRRLGRRRLAAVREGLSRRDLAVLADIGRFRLLTSRQLETLHFNEAATPLTAARTCRRVLRRLTSLGLLHRLERRIGGLHAGSAAFIYALSDGGQRLLDGGADAPRKRLHEPSLPFVAHTLAIAELYVALVISSRQDSGIGPGIIELLDVQTEPACWRRWSRGDGSGEVLRPDLSVSLGVGSDELRWFVEVDRGSEHLPTVLRKAATYQRYYDSAVEQTREGVFPRVLWVVPDGRRAQQLAAGLQRERGLTAELFAVSPSDAAVQRLRQ
jgi:Replication-relaxation